MRLAIILSCLIVCVACGSNSDPCTVAQNADGSTTISCPDGTSSTLQGGAGTDGFSSITLVDNIVGNQCDTYGNGGQRTRTGLDDGLPTGTARNGILEDGEVDTTSYLCNGMSGTNGSDGSHGEDGFSSITLVDTIVDDQCDAYGNGGQRVRTGFDDGLPTGIARNGILEDGEVDTTSYLCNGMSGTNGTDGAPGSNGFSSITLVDNVVGTECDVYGNGGERVRIGLDDGLPTGTAHNGLLEEGEVDATNYICNGATGPSGPGVVWNETATGQTAVAHNGYIINAATTQTMTLPASPSIGDSYFFVAANRSGFKVMPGNAAHIIEYAPRSTTDAVAQVALTTGASSSIALTASADGTRLYYAQVNGSVFHSYDSGYTWAPATTNLSSYFIGKISASADGRILLASSYNANNALITSQDYGQNWTAARGTTTNGYYGSAISQNGSVMYAAVRGDYLYRSTNFGATWSSGGSTSGDWYGVATSADGNTAVACQSSGQIYVTYDGGSTWTQKGARDSCQTVAISADGTKMYAVGTQTNYPLYASSDAGATWGNRGAAHPFVSLAASADGYRLVAGTGFPYGTWISHDGGDNWVQVATHVSITHVGINASGSTPLSTCYTCNVSTFRNANDHWYSGMCFIGGFSEGAKVEIVYVGNNRFVVASGEGIDLY